LLGPISGFLVDG